jgi:antitoxin VapB
MRIAKVFRNGRSQAIRLPKEFQVKTDEVYLKKTAEGFVVILRDPWEVFFEGVAELSDDFMTRGREQQPTETRNWKP